MQLYEKVPHGKTHRYVLSNAKIKPEPPHQESFTNGEIVTLGASLGMMVLMQMEISLPEKARLPRKLNALRAAILDLVKGNGARIDDEMVDHWADCWNRTLATVARECGQIPIIDELDEGTPA